MLLLEAVPLLPTIFLLWRSPPHKQQVAGQSLPLCPPLLLLKDSGASHLPEGASSSKLATLFPLPITNTSAPSWFFVSFLLSHYKGIASLVGIFGFLSPDCQHTSRCRLDHKDRCTHCVLNEQHGHKHKTPHMCMLDLTYLQTRPHKHRCLTSHTYIPEFHIYIHTHTRLHIHPHLIPHTIPYAHIHQTLDMHTPTPVLAGEACVSPVVSLDPVLQSPGDCCHSVAPHPGSL